MSNSTISEELKAPLTQNIARSQPSQSIPKTTNSQSHQKQVRNQSKYSSEKTKINIQNQLIQEGTDSRNHKNQRDCKFQKDDCSTPTKKNNEIERNIQNQTTGDQENDSDLDQDYQRNQQKLKIQQQQISASTKTKDKGMNNLNQENIVQGSLKHPELQNLMYSPPQSLKTNKINFEEVNNLTSTKNRRNNKNFFNKIGELSGGGLALSQQTHKESDNYSSDSGTFQMQKSEFSQRRQFGAGTGKNLGHSQGNKSIISRVFSFKKESDLITKMNASRSTRRQAQNDLLKNSKKRKNHSGSRYNKRNHLMEGCQNSYNQNWDNNYPSSGGAGIAKYNYLDSENQIRKLQNQDQIRTKTNASQNYLTNAQFMALSGHKYVNSFNQHHSTVLSQTKDQEIHASTPGQIKQSMKALQFSVNALLERAYYQNSNQNGSNYGIIQYPTISQIQKYQTKQYVNPHLSTDLTNKQGQNPNEVCQQLQQPLLDRDALAQMFRISLHENQIPSQINQINALSPPLNSLKNKRQNQSNRNTREIIGLNMHEKMKNMNERVSKTRTEAKYGETQDDDLSQGNQDRVKGLTSNKQQVMSQYGYEVDDNQLNQDEIKLFALLQDPHNETELQNLLDSFPYQTLVNLHNTTGYSALHVATCNNNSNYTQILISHILNSSKELDNDSVQRETEDMFQNPLHTDEQDLIERHLNLSQKAKAIVQNWINQLTLGVEEQFAAIHFAAFNGNLKIMQMLERFGGDIRLSNNQGINCMHFASQGNWPKILHYLIKQHEFLIDETDSNGCSALHWACVSGSYQAVRYLLAEGANPNLQQLEELLTPLHMTLKYLDETREIRTIHKLLIYGAYIDLQDENKLTPTDYVEHIEDEDLRDQCISLINDVAYKSNGLFPCFKRCRRVNRSLKVVRKRKYFLMLLIGMIFQLFLWLFYINPIIEIFDGEAFTEIFIQAIQGSFNFLIISMLLYLWKSDPGQIKSIQSFKSGISLMTNSDITYDKIIEDVDFKQICPECKIIMSKRSRHCYCCQRCVERFDHHCDWIDNCVGIKNHQMFMFFIVTLLFYLIFTICLTIDQLIFKFGRGDVVHTNFFAIFPKETYYIGIAQFLIAVMGLMCLIFLIPLASLVFLQLRNLCSNLTTYERFSKSAQKAMNTSQSTTVANQNQNGTNEENTITNEINNVNLILNAQNSHENVHLLIGNSDQDHPQAILIKDQNFIPSAKVTEDSDEIEAIKNNKEFEMLKSKSQNKSSDKRHLSSLDFKSQKQNIQIIQQQLKENKNINPIQIENKIRLSSHQQEKDIGSNSLANPLCEKPSMTSLNRPSQSLEFQSDDQSIDLEQNNNKFNTQPTNNSIKLVMHKEEQNPTPDMNVIPFQLYDNPINQQLINHANPNHHNDQQDPPSKNTLSTNNNQRSKRSHDHGSWLNFISNCKIMCCQTEIKTQSELYYELIRRQQNKKKHQNIIFGQTN